MFCLVYVNVVSDESDTTDEHDFEMQIQKTSVTIFTYI